MSCDVDLTFLANLDIVERAKGDKRDYSHFHASEFDRCHRKIGYSYYESKGLFKIDPGTLKIDPRIQRIFENGHSMHDRWKNYLESTGALYGCWMCENWTAHSEPVIYGKESKLGIPRPEKCSCGANKFRYIEVGFFDEETWWGGHTDAIVGLAVISARFKGMPKQDDFIVVDFKSMRTEDFQCLHKPKPEHITQIQIYMHLSGLNYGKFIYENKNDQSVKEFLVERDQPFIDVKRAEAINLKHILTTLKDGKRVLPPRAHPDKNTFECRYCKYKNYCWK